MKIFPKSSFFKERRASTLSTPAEIRAINETSNNVDATFIHRTPPVRIPSLGLLVKYGSAVTIVEAQTQMMIREQLQDQVLVPEIFGWTEDEAIIDWGQAGWYPAYWEYCKARYVTLDPQYEPFGLAVQEEWRAKYLPMVLKPVDVERYYHPWLCFVLSGGC